MPNSFVFTWLQQRVGSEALPSPEVLQAAKDFALLWMYFEGRSCKMEANGARLREFANALYARKASQLQGKLENQVTYFKNRYSEVQSDPAKFIARLGDPKRIKAADRDAITDALTKPDLPDVEKAIGLLLITFRIRNNLFHGSKQLQVLQQQSELFAQLSQVLVTLLEASEA